MAEDLEREADGADDLANSAPAFRPLKTTPPSAPLRAKDYKPGTRQLPKPPAKATGELPWYAKVKPGESMMAAAKEEQGRMSATKAASRVSGVAKDLE